MALGTDKDITIRVRVDGNGAIQSFEQLDAAEKKLKTTTEDSVGGFSKLQSTIVSLDSALNLATRGFDFVTNSVSKVFSVLERGSSVDDVEQGFARLAKQAGVLSDTLLNDLVQASGSTVDNVTLMKGAVESMRAGVKPDEIVELTKAARALAEQTGGSLTQELDDLKRAFETGNTRVLQNKLGVIDLEKAQDALASSLGVTRDKLSKEGEVMAARNALLEAAKKKTAEVGEISEDAGDKIAKAQADLKNKFDELYKSIAGDAGVLGALDALGDIVKNFPWGFFAESAKGVADALGALTGASDTFFEHLKLISIEARRSGAFDMFMPGASQIAGAERSALIAKMKAEREGALADIKEAQADLAALSKVSESAAAKPSGIMTAALTGGKVSASAYDAIELLDSYRSKVEKLIGLYRDNTIGIGKLDKGLVDLGASFMKAGGTSDEFKSTVGKAIAEAGEEIKSARDKTIKDLDELNSQDGGFFTRLFNVQGTQEELAAFENVAGNIANAMASAAQGGFERSDVRVALSGIGAALGAYFTESAWGATVGAAVGDGLGAMFEGWGKDSSATRARKAIDAWFGDLFSADRLTVLINGQLERISDLEFSGGQFGNENFFEGLFALTPETRSAFDSIGYALAELNGEATEIAGNIGAVLANNIGGSLNNLQILIETVGASAEQMSEAIVSSFKEGTISALQAQTALIKIQQVMTKGIPDGLGLVTQAVDNMFAAGSKGGRALLDGLQDIGFEAAELGLHSFPQAAAEILKSGKYTQEQIDAIFRALQAVGIDTIDELTAATEDQLIPALAQLEAEGFLTDAAERAAELADQISELPENKTVTLNVKTNFDSNTRQAIDSGIFSSSGSHSVSQAVA